MRFLHTADWHIGKIVNDFSMIEYQREMLKQIIYRLKEVNYDALIVAGDIYDRSLPSSESMALVNETLKSILLDTQTPVLLISGNHDSGQQIEFGNFLFENQQCYNQGIIKKTMKRVRFGDTDFYLFPFVTPYHYSRMMNMEVKTFNQIFEIEMSKIQFENKQNVLITHGFFIKDGIVVEKEDSVRPLSIGTAEYVDVNLFSQFDYVACGHLHGYQQVGSPKVQYSGSLCKYSKSEAKNKISVNDVSLNNNELQVERVYLIPSKDMVIKRGMLSDLIKEGTNDFVFYELLDAQLQLDAMTKLKAVSPYAMGLSYENIEFKAQTERLNKQELSHRSLIDLFETYYNERKSRPLTPNQKEFLEQVIVEASRETT